MTTGWVAFLLLAGCGAALENKQALNVSRRCMEDTNSFLWEITQGRPKEYAVLMYDAFGKMGSNVEGGNVNRPGLLQECHSAHGPTFSGQYCQVFLGQGAVQYLVGICVPDSCGEEDVQNLVLHGSLQYGQTSLIPPLPPVLVNQSTQELIMIHCLPDTIRLDASDITCLTVCCVMLAIPLAATLFTAIKRWQRNKEVSPTAESSCLNTDPNLYGTLKTNGSSSIEVNSSISEDKDNSSRPCFLQSCVHRYLQAFSLQTTTKGVLRTSSSIPGGYSSLHGIRVLSLLWIICGHSTQQLVTTSVDNFKDWKNVADSNPLQMLAISGPIFLAVDTYLLLGGLLSARSLLGSISRAEDKLSPGLVATYYFRRFKRVQPMHMFIICLCTVVISLMQCGTWFQILQKEMNCKKYWWANVLLVTNLIQVRDICAPWTWYLALDYQCYATTPLLVYFYRLNRGVFVVVAGGLLLMTTAAGAILTALMYLPVFQPEALTSGKYGGHYYVKPYTRYGPFLIGILAGIYMTTKKEALLKQKWQAALGWFCSLVLMALVLGLSYLLKETPDHPSVAHALYQGLHRQLWTLAVTWIILACEEGYGGFIKSFLSWGVWSPLSNISYATYMTHSIFIIIYIGLQGTSTHYTDISFMYLFSGHIVLTLPVSYILTVLVEKPFVLLKWNNT